MEKLALLIDSLVNIKPSEVLKTLPDKIKSFSPQQKIEQLESFLASLSKKQRILLSLSLFALGGSLLSYSLINAAQSSKAYLNNLKQNQHSKAQVANNDSIAGLVSKASKSFIDQNRNNLNNQASDNQFSTSWRDVNYLLASTPERRAKALEKLAFNQDEGVIVAVSLTCPECIKLAQDINAKQVSEKVLAVAIGTDSEVKEWKEKLKLNYEVKPISETDMDNLGVVLFPTLIKVSKTVTPKTSKKTGTKLASLTYEIVASSDDGRVLANDSNK